MCVIDYTGIVTTLAGAVPWVDGVGSVAHFYYPRGISVSSNGAVYVVDSLNYRIRKVYSSGVWRSVVVGSHIFILLLISFYVI